MGLPANTSPQSRGLTTALTIKGRIKFEFAGTGAARICRAWARLAEDPEEVVEYVSPPFASITPKNNPLWKSDPDQQHAYYAGRALCRRHFPDVLLGVYADDELEAASRGDEAARDVTPAKGLAARLDALAGKPAPQEVEEAEVADDLEAQAAAGEGRQDDAEIDATGPDYNRGFRDGEAGTKKCLSDEIRSDPARFATWEAGHRDGTAAREREGAVA
ncbi:recombinase RecT [Methylobacterium phyllosphaerae]